MREVVSTKDAPQAIGPYSQAIKARIRIHVRPDRHRSCDEQVAEDSRRA